MEIDLILRLEETVVQKVEGSVQRVIALVEEQNARNNGVIDAYKVVVGRLETKVFGAES